MSCDSPVLEQQTSLHVGSGRVESLQSSHALLLISLSTWAESLNAGFVNFRWKFLSNNNALLSVGDDFIEFLIWVNNTWSVRHKIKILMACFIYQLRYIITLFFLFPVLPLHILLSNCVLFSSEWWIFCPILYWRFPCFTECIHVAYMLRHVLSGSSPYRHTEFIVNLFCNLPSGQLTMIQVVIFMMSFSLLGLFLKLFLKSFYVIWHETRTPDFQDSHVCRISVNP